MERRLCAFVGLILFLSLGLASGSTARDPALNLSMSMNPLTFVLASNGGNSIKYPPAVVSGIGIDTMIRKGHEASEAMFPFMASLQVLWSDNRLYHICGCVLFAINKLVTAAHCMIYWGEYEHFVSLGVQFISRGGEALIRVENATVHPGFDPYRSDYPWDVAVLALETDATLTSKVQLATLATFQDKPFDKFEDCEIVGWGSTMGGQIPDGLHYAILKGISNNDCRRFLRIFKYRGLQQYHKCAWNWPHASCQGDSGGPLVCEGLIVGISSWGVEGCTGCFPSMYSRVSYHHNWISLQ